MTGAARARAWEFDFRNVVTRLYPMMPIGREAERSGAVRVMSAAAQPAINLGAIPGIEDVASVGSRKLARRFCQALMLLPLFSLILLPEYVQGLGDPESKSILYRGTLGPLRIIDVLLLAMIAAHAAVWASSRRMLVRFPRELVAPGLGFLGTIALAMIYGALHGGTNLFFDWRALALGIGTYVLFAMWIQTPEEVRWATYWFAGYMALRIAMLYCSFLGGGGDEIVGVRIPVFDGPTLSAIVFTAVLALWMGDCAHRLVAETVVDGSQRGGIRARFAVLSSNVLGRAGSCDGSASDAAETPAHTQVAVGDGGGRGSGGNARSSILPTHAEPGLHKPGSQSSARETLTMSVKFWMRGSR